jgi:hypothetical protein
MDPPDSEKGGSAERQALEWCTTGYGTQNSATLPAQLDGGRRLQTWNGRGTAAFKTPCEGPSIRA